MKLLIRKYQLVVAYYFFFFSVLLLIVNVLFFILTLFDALLSLGNYPSWSIAFLIIHFFVAWGINRLSSFFIKRLREGMGGLRS